MKTITPELQAHLAQSVTTICNLWRVTRRDGTVFGFTDHMEDIVFEGVTYEAFTGYTASAVSTQAALNVDNLEIDGMFDSAGITIEDLEGGVWDGAVVRLSQVNYADLSMGDMELRTGEIGEVQHTGAEFTAELRGLMQYLQNNIGRIITPSCDAELGDARCKVDLEALRVSGTVTAVTSRQVFSASGLAAAAGYFTYGVITFTSGANDGMSMEIKAHAGGGVLTTRLDMPFTVAIGDTFTIVPGCNKLLKTGDGQYNGDCKIKFNNVPNFQGFPEVPGNDRLVSYGGQ